MVLGLVPGLSDEIDCALCAMEEDRTYRNHLDKDLKETGYLDMSWCVIPSPCHEGPRMIWEGYYHACFIVWTSCL